MTEVSGATLGSLGGRGRVGKMSKIKKKLHREESGKYKFTFGIPFIFASLFCLAEAT